MPEILLTYEFFVLELESILTVLSIRIVVYQPQYFPRLHYFARILNAEIFAIADNLQYVRKHAYPSPDGKNTSGFSYQAHTPIKIGNGSHLLSVPVCHKGSKEFYSINQAPLQYCSSWAQDHIETVRQHYAKAPYFSSVFPSLERVLSTPYRTLADLTVESILWGLAVLFEKSSPLSLADVQTVLPQDKFRLREVRRLSQTPVLPADKTAGRDANDWLIDVSKFFGADEYYFGGTGGAAYMNFKKFEDAGIRLLEQNWPCREYPQQFSKQGFVKNLSIIDLLMNVSASEARAILHTEN